MPSFPAIEMKMGSWKYYIARMTMRQVAKNIGFAYEIPGRSPVTLNQVLQRELNKGRAKSEIASFLANREDRFFPSIVVTCIEENPIWVPVGISPSENSDAMGDFAHRRISAALGNDKPIGLIDFNDDSYFYALDGQHRLKAIKMIVEDDPELQSLGIQKPRPSQEGVESFDQETMSVMIVSNHLNKPIPEYFKSVRRLFTSINRYSKPMDEDSKIVLDEDDAFAITTRRLINEHPFFVSTSSIETESTKIKYASNLRSQDTHITTLRTLYKINETMVSYAFRSNLGWATDRFTGLVIKKSANFKKYRPEDEILEEIYQNISNTWDAIIEVIPEIKLDPNSKRNLNADIYKDPSVENPASLLFYVIGQEILGSIVKELINIQLFEGNDFPDDASLITKDHIKRAIQPLSAINWNLHSPPWRFLLLTLDPDTSKWKMRSSDRKEATEVALKILRYLVGIIDNDDDIEDLKFAWQPRLSPNQDEETENQLWEEIVQLRNSVQNFMNN